MVRADHGTENSQVAKCRIAFRMNHKDCLSGAKSFIYEPSTPNIVSFTYGLLVAVHSQRIEAWWSQLRRFKTDWWIDLCKVCPTYL